MNVALVVVISLVIVVPVFAAAGVMMWKSHRSQALAEASQDKERSISTDGCSVDVECEPRLRDLVVESVRRKRASLEGSGMTRSSSTSSSARFSNKRQKKLQLTKIQSEEPGTRVPSHDVVVVTAV